jgi:hypothetical protein
VAMGHSEDGVGEEKSSAAPNISLNFQDPEVFSPIFPGAPRIKLLIATTLGVVLQTGVLAYFWILTFALKFKGGDGSSYSKAGVGLAFSGTLFLVVGMFTCAHVINQSTQKKGWVKMKSGEAGEAKKERFRLLWVQNRETVAGEYDSYVILADDWRSVILTSHRKPKNKDDFWTKAAVRIGSGAALSGFIMQLFGIGMMHWSVAVAQFVVTLIMITVRAVVRQNLSQKPNYHEIPAKHELDWVAMRLAYSPDVKRYLYNYKPDKEETGPESGAQRSWNWIVMTGDVDASGSGFITPGRPGEAHLALKVRERLGKLSETMGKTWTGPAAKTAISVSNAIENIMNSFFQSRSGKLKYWSIPVRMDNVTQAVYFRLEWDGHRWKSSVEEIEAFLSLWLFALRSQNGGRTIRKVGTWTTDLQNDLIRWGGETAGITLNIAKDEEYDDGDSDDDDGDWKYEPFNQQRVFGFSDPDTAFGGNERRKFWTKSLRAFVRDQSRQDLVIDDPVQRTTVAKNDRKRYIMVSFDESLPTICAHELVFRFLKTALSDKSFKTMKDDTILETNQTPESWDQVRLKNSKVSDLARKVNESGLISFEHALLYVVAVLSHTKTKKLPDAQSVLDFTKARALNFKSRGQWQLLKRDDVKADFHHEDRQTPLSWAAAEGHEGVVRLLLQRNDVETNSRDYGKRTPLSWAAKEGHEEVVRLLLKRDDVEVNCQDEGHRTPLAWAAEKGHEGVVLDRSRRA